MPSEEENHMKLPSENQLQSLLNEAKIRSAKIDYKEKTVRERFTENSNRYVDEVLGKDEQKGDPYLQLKATALRCLKELSDMHCEFAKKRIEEENYENGLFWASDQGKLDAAFELIRSVRVGGEDWMKDETP